MKSDLRLTFRRGDWIAVFFVVALAACVLLAFSGENHSAGMQVVQVFRSGELLHELSLQENQTLQVSGVYSNTVTIENGRAGITESNCPGNDCVHSGWIDSGGRSIVCLPNRVEIRITGAASDVDFIVG